MASNQSNEWVNPEFTPPVSVVIPVYNGEADLPDLLACLQAQTYPLERVEYLLIDNGSRDRTPDLLKTAAQNLTALGLTIHHLNETQIQSSYAARNVGIKAARGEILAFTDADCRPQPNWLSNLVRPFLKSEVGIVAGEIVALPGNTLLERYADRQETLSQKHTLAHPFHPYGQTANLAIRRQIFEQVGLFRPYLTTGGDADLCWRIQEAGSWQIGFAEQATVQHRHRTTIAELGRQWHRYGRSNRYLHDLHGVNLMRELTLGDYLYRWSRWLLKELPTTVKKVVTHKTDFLELLSIPLDLFCAQARSRGQQEARLADQARQIEWIDQPSEASANPLE